MPATGTPIFSAHISTEVDRAVSILRKVDGVKYVWFFGSHAQYRGRPDSDLDFAVEGLPRENHYAVLGELMLALRKPVDLVRWEEASNALRAEIKRQGTVVYAD